MGTESKPGTGSRWREHYKSRLVQPEDVAAQVRSGNRLYVVTSHESAPLLAALLGRADELTGAFPRTRRAAPRVKTGVRGTKAIQ